MPAKPHRTSRFEEFNRPEGAIALAFTLFAIIACLLASRTGKPVTRLNVSGFTDPEVLEHVVDRVRGGENYYEAAGDELRVDHFHVRSVFNWRQPLYAWLLAFFPRPMIGQLLQAASAIVLTLLAARFLLRECSVAGALVGVALIPGACYGAFVGWGATTLEIWAGILIAISIFTYAADLWMLGMALALIALFVRELAAPYVLVCVGIALYNKRRREAAGWMAGLTLYAGYFAVHVSHVLANLRPTDTLDATGWVRFGGLHFILTTAGQSLVFRWLPLWTVAIYLPLAVLGLIAIPSKPGNRAIVTVAAYFVFFAVVGKTFNDYWGFVYSPLLALGFAFLPSVAGHLWNAITRPAMAAAR